jgi:hypothetical protein
VRLEPASMLNVGQLSPSRLRRWVAAAPIVRTTTFPQTEPVGRPRAPSCVTVQAPGPLFTVPELANRFENNAGPDQCGP